MMLSEDSKAVVAASLAAGILSARQDTVGPKVQIFDAATEAVKVWAACVEAVEDRLRIP
jgi:hypothetical protein